MPSSVTVRHKLINSPAIKRGPGILDVIDNERGWGGGGYIKSYDEGWGEESHYTLQIYKIFTAQNRQYLHSNVTALSLIKLQRGIDMHSVHAWLDMCFWGKILIDEFLNDVLKTNG